MKMKCKWNYNSYVVNGIIKTCIIFLLLITSKLLKAQNVFDDFKVFYGSGAHVELFAPPSDYIDNNYLIKIGLMKHTPKGLSFYQFVYSNNIYGLEIGRNITLYRQLNYNEYQIGGSLRTTFNDFNIIPLANISYVFKMDHIAVSLIYQGALINKIYAGIGVSLGYIY